MMGCRGENKRDKQKKAKRKRQTYVPLDSCFSNFLIKRPALKRFTGLFASVENIVGCQGADI